MTKPVNEPLGDLGVVGGSNFPKDKVAGFCCQAPAGPA